jgi:hypothetical protein
MNYQADVEVRDFALPCMATLSEDGYVRLTFESFCNLPLFHLLSGLDEDNPVSSSEGAILTVISGYTEWISTTTPAITLGWDWQLTASRGQPRCVRISEPRSNIMLLDAQRRDLGAVKTARLLETTIDRLSWQDAVIKGISYPSP